MKYKYVGLTYRERKVLKNFEDYTKSYDGATPTLRQQADMMGCVVSNIHRIVNNLVKKGYLGKVYSGKTWSWNNYYIDK